jgi:hypothetical protein
VWKEKTHCGRKELSNVASGCGQNRLTDVLRNHMTCDVASGCGKERLTEVLINYIITYHVASGCGREGPKF